MTGNQLLRAAKLFGEVTLAFRFPYVHMTIVSDSFNNLNEDEREYSAANSLHTTVGELRETARNLLFSLHWVTKAEFEAQQIPLTASRGSHWLTSVLNGSTPSAGTKLSPVPAIHFYGYKGGQARSTLLAMLSVALAEDGWKVLVVDSDIEAPSLDVIYARTARVLSSTLLGIAQDLIEIQPERVRSAKSGQGSIDLIACRPRSTEFDIDAVAFALRTSLDPSILERAALKIGQLALREKYDVILVDHRAGLSTSTMPWQTSLAGPTVVCVRLDEQWRPAQSFIKGLLALYPQNPGVFISWKPDDENPETYRQRNVGQIEALLDLLADAISSKRDVTPDLFEISAMELEDHWLMWPYEQSFRLVRLPELEVLSALTLGSLRRLRSLLDLSRSLSSRGLTTEALSPSGAIDEGDLIQTDALRELRTHGSPISYILGRKGTGKTRLLRELSVAGIGEPLVVDANSSENRGIKSPSPELQLAAERFKNNPDNFWWCLLGAALQNKSTNTEILRDNLARQMASGKDPLEEVLGRVRSSPKRTFLLDGLETAFSARNIFGYIESLFRFLAIVDSDSRIADRIQFKLFLRSDLAERGYQNVEQQLAGRMMYLSWDTQTIFNFVLSRIGQMEWYRSSFPDLTRRIEGAKDQILKGALPTEDCEELLLLAFPDKIRRNNLATKTFLKTYFADTASDKPELSARDKLRYYPRIFDKFLRVIANPEPTDVGSFTEPQLEVGKISQALIFVAHEAASREYLNQLQSELVFLINLADEPAENSDRISSLLGAFAGLKTPFKLDDCISELRRKLPFEVDIRSAMEKMKSVGIFEDRPEYPDEWRVGRLFKSSLRMKYVR
jgi:hypothetical protein